jgi:serine/threonine protein kinase
MGNDGGSAVAAVGNDNKPCRAAGKGEAKLDLSSFHNNYLIMNKIGQGNFGRVYKCREVLESGISDTELAVKIMDMRRRVDNKAVDEKAQRLWRCMANEVRVLNKIGTQKNCMHSIAHFVEGKIAYIVIEYCPLTLLEALESGPTLTEQTLAKFYKDMLQGLDAIHNIGVVHRDIKPENFLCSYKPNSPYETVVKLVDFGLAGTLNREKPELRGVYGTPPYMSPEMVRGLPYGATTDIWSFGVIVYVLFFGEFPYFVPSANPKKIKECIATGNEPRFRIKAGLNSDGSIKISEAGTHMVKCLLNRDVEQRPTAKKALQANWLYQNEEDEESPNLFCILASAKQKGAFEMRKVHDSVDELHAFLCEEQAKYHPNLGVGLLSASRGLGGSGSKRSLAQVAPVKSNPEKNQQVKDTCSCDDSSDRQSWLAQEHGSLPSAMSTDCGGGSSTVSRYTVDTIESC